MKKFMVIYHAPADAFANMPEMTPEQVEAGMKLWNDWRESAGAAVVDFGSPLMVTTSRQNMLRK